MGVWHGRGKFREAQKVRCHSQREGGRVKKKERMLLYTRQQNDGNVDGIGGRRKAILRGWRGAPRGENKLAGEESVSLKNGGLGGWRAREKTNSLLKKGKPEERVFGRKRKKRRGGVRDGGRAETSRKCSSTKKLGKINRKGNQENQGFNLLETRVFRDTKKDSVGKQNKGQVMSSRSRTEFTDKPRLLFRGARKTD